MLHNYRKENRYDLPFVRVRINKPYQKTLYEDSVGFYLIVCRHVTYSDVYQDYTLSHPYLFCLFLFLSLQGDHIIQSVFSTYWTLIKYSDHEPPGFLPSQTKQVVDSDQTLTH